MPNEMVNHINMPKMLVDKCIMLPKSSFDRFNPKLVRDYCITFKKYKSFKEMHHINQFEEFKIMLTFTL